MLMFFFASPVDIILTGWVYSYIYIVFIAKIAAVIALVLVISKFIFKVRFMNQIKLPTAVKKPSEANNGNWKIINNYLAGVFVDAFIAAVTSAMLYNLGIFGESNNDTWHLTVVISAVIFLFFRLGMRLFSKLSLGEKIVKAQPYTAGTLRNIYIIDAAIVIAFCYFIYSQYMVTNINF